jgi:hypothetical protein
MYTSRAYASSLSSLTKCVFFPVTITVSSYICCDLGLCVVCPSLNAVDVFFMRGDDADVARDVERMGV